MRSKKKSFCNKKEKSRKYVCIKLKQLKEASSIFTTVASVTISNENILRGSSFDGNTSSENAAETSIPLSVDIDLKADASDPISSQTITVPGAVNSNYDQQKALSIDSALDLIMGHALANFSTQLRGGPTA